MDESAITCHEFLGSYDEETNFNEKKQSVKHKFLYVTCIFVNYHSIIDRKCNSVRIYCYLIKYRTKQKHLLPFHDTNNVEKNIIQVKH